MKAFKRADDELFGVIKEDGVFKIALFTTFSINMHSVNNSNAYHIYDAEFPNRELAEKVCEMLSEVYSEGLNDNYS